MTRVEKGWLAFVGALIVAALVLSAVGVPHWHEVVPNGWTVTSDPYLIELALVTTGDSAEARGTVLSESDDTVQLAGYFRPDHNQPGSGHNLAKWVVLVRLDRPLDGRQVVDCTNHPIMESLG